MKFMFLRYAEQKAKIMFVISLVFFMFYLSFAQNIYYYIDDQGVMHFVDDESLIPEKYQKKSKPAIKLEEKRELMENNADKPQSKTDLKQGETKKDKFGNSPSYWRARYKALQDEKFSKEKELRSLEEQRDEVAKKYESARSKAFFIGDSQSITEAASLENRLRDIENSIKITLKALDELNRKLSVDIYDELLQAGGDPSWLITGE
jgi:hypothetical protein